MIVHPCLGCCWPDLPIEALRCPKCGEENFIPLNRPLSAPESPPEPINETTGFCDGSTEQTGEAKAILTGCSPNQHEETETMSININFCNEEHTDGIGGTNIKVNRSEGAGEIKSRYQNINWKQKQQLQNCSNCPAIENSAIQEIPSPYDQAYSFNAEDNYACDSTSPNFSATVSAHGEGRQNHQPQSKRKNESSDEVGVQELSQFKNENGEIDFAGCSTCLKQFCEGQLSLNDDAKPYKCKKCLCSFSESRSLKRHLVVHSKEKPFKCGQCDYTCKRSDYLNEHILTRHTKPENKSSSEVVSDVDELSQFKNENGEIDFAGCSKCLRQFCAGQLSFHGDSKPLKCEKCMCRFDERRLLKRHLGVHSLKRPFKCGPCGIAYKYKYNLDNHILTRHTKQ